MMILVPPCSDNDASLLFNSIQHFLLMGWDDGKYDEEQLFVPQFFCLNLWLVFQGAASAPAGSDDNLAMLEKAVPGIPGEDYPIYAEVPESGFSCDGQVDGGYYADPEAQCQVFHICTADGAGGLAQYSFLCPNGTVFNQNYFICDWWFNFDCAEAEGLYGLNDQIRAEAEAAAANEPQGSYASPDSAPIGGYDAPADVIEDAQAAYGQAARNARNGRGPQNFGGFPNQRQGRRQGRRQQG